MTKPYKPNYPKESGWYAVAFIISTIFAVIWNIRKFKSVMLDVLGASEYRYITKQYRRETHAIKKL